MRTLLVLAALLCPLAVAACGEDDVRNKTEEIRKDAEQAIDDLKPGATKEDIEQELEKVRQQLDQADLPREARQKLEQAKEQLQQAERRATDGK